MIPSQLPNTQTDHGTTSSLFAVDPDIMVTKNRTIVCITPEYRGYAKEQDFFLKIAAGRLLAQGSKRGDETAILGSCSLCILLHDIEFTELNIQKRFVSGSPTIRSYRRVSILWQSVPDRHQVSPWTPTPRLTALQVRSQPLHLWLKTFRRLNSRYCQYCSMSIKFINAPTSCIAWRCSDSRK